MRNPAYLFMLWLCTQSRKKRAGFDEEIFSETSYFSRNGKHLSTHKSVPTAVKWRWWYGGLPTPFKIKCWEVRCTFAWATCSSVPLLRSSSCETLLLHIHHLCQGEMGRAYCVRCFLQRIPIWNASILCTLAHFQLHFIIAAVHHCMWLPQQERALKAGKITGRWTNCHQWADDW